jgi:hypothetical protein
MFQNAIQGKSQGCKNPGKKSQTLNVMQSIQLSALSLCRLKSFLLMAGCLIPYKPQKALPQSLLQQQQPDKTVLQ